MSDQTEEVSLTSEELRSRVGALQSLLRSDAWDLQAKALKAQYGSRVSEIIGSDDHSQDGMLRREFLRGEARALVTALRLPEILLQVAKDDLALQVKLEETQNDGNSSNTPSSASVHSGDWVDDSGSDDSEQHR